MEIRLTRIIKIGNRFLACNIPSAVLILLFASLTSCGATYRIYQGDALPPEKIGVLKIPGGIDTTETVRIKDVDGVRRGNFYGSLWDGSGQIEFLPGKHSIVVYVWLRGYQSFERRLDFIVEAGKTYVVRHERVGGIGGTYYELKVEDETVKKEKYKIEPY